MLEIEEIKPLYICEYRDSFSGFKCHEDDKRCYIYCHHTSNSFHAENPESVKIFEKFCDTFGVYVDDLGRLVCYEKENKNAKR